MSDNNSYYDLAQRIEDAFPEIDSDIVINFAENHEEYATLRAAIAEMKQKYSFIDKAIEGDGGLTLSAEEHKILTEYFRQQFRLDNMERQQLYFRGHTDCMAYLKKMGAF